MLQAQFIFQVNNVEKGLFMNIVCVSCLQETSESAYPPEIRLYKRYYCRMSKEKYRRELTNYAEKELHDPVKSLGWKQLLKWEHRHLKYTKEELPKPRARMPIDILAQAEGRCSEFALLFNGLLLANRYRSRIVLDRSTLKDKTKKTAGDHVWNEILIDGIWIHVDPTEKRINQPLMYTSEWHKDVNMVYAIDEKEILDVTDRYKIQT